jgi:hypothetical protein
MKRPDFKWWWALLIAACSDGIVVKCQGGCGEWTVIHSMPLHWLCPKCGENYKP